VEKRDVEGWIAAYTVAYRIAAEGPTVTDIDMGREARAVKRLPRRRVVLALLCAAAVLWGGWSGWMDWHYQTAMAEISTEVAAGRYAIAARDLAELLASKPDSDEAAYLLGACEQARGRNQAAVEAWARVTPGSAFWDRAIMARIRLFHDVGRLTDVEQLIRDAAEDPRSNRTAALVLLAPIYAEEGRLDEAERLIEAHWEHLNKAGEGALEPAIKLVRLHIELTWKSNPVETLRAYLEQAVGRAPWDDRVWLGQANLAIRTGADDAADHLLDACLKRRPEDVPAWRARLNWGIATDRIAVVLEALRHVPAAECKPAQVHRLQAWLSAKQNDVETERRELEKLLVEDPADGAALDRLVQLAVKDEQPTRAAELLAKKAEIVRLRARYEKLFDRNQPLRDAVEMARLAQYLGRPFEARAFLTLGISEDPGRHDLRRDLERLSQTPKRFASGEQTLADVLVQQRRDERKIEVTPSR
jgi:enediyne biosynthesis protein E4